LEPNSHTAGDPRVLMSKQGKQSVDHLSPGLGNGLRDDPERVE